MFPCYVTFRRETVSLLAFDYHAKMFDGSSRILLAGIVHSFTCSRCVPNIEAVEARTLFSGTKPDRSPTVLSMNNLQSSVPDLRWRKHFKVVVFCPVSTRFSRTLAFTSFSFHFNKSSQGQQPFFSPIQILENREFYRLCQLH